MAARLGLDFQLGTVNLGGAGVFGDLVGTRQGSSLLYVAPFDVVRRGVESQAALEPTRLCTGFVIPQAVGAIRTIVLPASLGGEIAGIDPTGAYTSGRACIIEIIRVGLVRDFGLRIEARVLGAAGRER